MNEKLTGLHHVTAITGNARTNVEFYAQKLGLRLVKKTVNQDDVSAYHLFYGDELGRPGTELTFFDWPAAGPNHEGTGTIAEIALRVGGGREALIWWSGWLRENGISVGELEEKKSFGAMTLPVTDPEGQRLRLVSSDAGGARPNWRGSPAPQGAAIFALDSVTLSVRRPNITERVLTEVLGFRSTGEGQFETGEGGPGARVYLRTDTQMGAPGIGGVHHVAFRTPDEDAQRRWRERIVAAGLGVSGIIDRFYFHSIYFREPNGVLFEIATDGPGFTADENAEQLGERLSLPPFLEAHRTEIEAGLRPLETSP